MRLNADFFKQIDHAKHLSKRIQPVFIVGMPRSGTSLTEQILSRHPAVHAAGERLEIPQFALSVCKDIGSQQSYPFCLSGIDRNSLNMMARQYIKKVAGQAERTSENCYGQNARQLSAPRSDPVTVSKGQDDPLHSGSDGHLPVLLF